MENKRMKGVMAFLGLVLLVAAAAYVFFDGFKASTQKPQRPSVPPVTLIPLQVHSMPLTVSTYGYTTSPNSMTVRALSSGTIESIHFQPGQAVKKGQLLCVIQASDVTQQMNYLKPQLIQAKANYERNFQANKFNQKVTQVTKNSSSKSVPFRRWPARSTCPPAPGRPASRSRPPR